MGGLQTTDEVSVIINDNGITGFPNDVVTVTSPPGDPLGIGVDSGGNLISLNTVDPSTIPNTSTKPENMSVGLIDMELKVDTVGGTATVTIYLSEPAPDGHTWYKYDATNNEWTDYSDNALFNPTRDQITLTLVDGGAGDNDGVANGVILDPSGLGTAPSSSAATTPINTYAGDWGAGDGGGGGCFIGSTSYGSLIESRGDAVGALVSRSLQPLVGMSRVALQLGPVAILVLMFVFLGVLSGMGLFLFRRPGPKKQDC